MKEELEQFVARMKETAGDAVESIVLYGSAARNDFDERYSDVNVLCVLRSVAASALEKIAPVMRWWSQEIGQRPPLVVTAEELRTSADVFAIETMDLKASGRVLYGSDILSGIEVSMNLHRIQVEHELRTLMLKLRQHYVLARENEKELEQAMAKSASSATVLLRHALIAIGRNAPESRMAVATAAGEAFGFDTTALQTALDLREGRRIQLSVAQAYDAYMNSFATVVQRIDTLVPKSEWQRMPSGAR